MLKHRLIFGTSMIFLLVGLLALDSWLDRLVLTDTIWQTFFFGRTSLPRGLVLLFAFLFLAVIASRELVSIFHAKGFEASRWVVTLSSVCGLLFMYGIPSGLDSQEAVAAFATLMVTLFLVALLRHSYWSKRTQGAVGAAGAAMFSLIYMGVLPGFYLAIRRWHDVWVIASIMLITKSCDIGAYFTGRLLGRHKLIPWLSPGKTWEGLVGGVCTAMLVAVCLAWLSNYLQLSGVFRGTRSESVFVNINYNLLGAAAAGVILGLLGQAGDLIASLFKRDAGIKDSGQSIPGFGGVLDVIDSPIVTAPVAYWLLRSLLG